MSSVPLPINLTTLNTHATSLIARLATLIDITQRGRSHIEDFADAELRANAGALNAAVNVGAPDANDIRNVVFGKPNAYLAKVTAMEARADVLATQGTALDVSAGDALNAIGKEAQIQLSPLSTALVPQPSSLFGSAVQALSALGAQAQPVSLPPVSNAMRRQMIAAAMDLAQARIAAELAVRVRARADALRAELADIERRVETLQRVLKRVRAEELGQAPALRTVLPYDLELDGPRVVRELLRGLPAVDWMALLTTASGPLDEGTLEQLIKGRLADAVDEIAQHPLHQLLPAMFRGRSWSQVIDEVVLNAASLAPIDPTASLTPFMGLSVGVAETKDPSLAAEVLRALRRAGDAIALKVDQPELPDDVLVSIVRTESIHGPETMNGYLGELLRRASDPGTRTPASQDWMGGPLPLPVSLDWLGDDIAARELRGENTAKLRRWLTKPEPTPSSTTKSPATGPSSPMEEDDTDEPTQESSFGRAAAK